MASRVQIVDYQSLRRTPKARPGTSNAQLQICKFNPGSPTVVNITSRIPLWISDMTTDFSLNGSYGQSAGKRDFYPRNFSQPSWTFAGQTHNEREYGQIAEFVRKGQLASIFSGGTSQYIMRMSLPASNIESVIWMKRDSDGTLIKVPTTRQNGVRGDRQGILLQGYIQNASRHHQRFVTSQEYTFDFVVQRHLAGPIHDDPVEINYLKSNWDSFINRDGAGIMTNPDDQIQQAKEDAAAADKEDKDQAAADAIQDAVGGLF